MINQQLKLEEKKLERIKNKTHKKRQFKMPNKIRFI